MRCGYWKNSENCCKIGGSPIKACNPALPLMDGLGIGGPKNPQECTTLQDYGKDMRPNQQTPYSVLRRECPYFVK